MEEEEEEEVPEDFDWGTEEHASMCESPEDKASLSDYRVPSYGTHVVCV